MDVHFATGVFTLPGFARAFSLLSGRVHFARGLYFADTFASDVKWRGLLLTSRGGVRFWRHVAGFASS
jgi:hypothetical protein